MPLTWVQTQIIRALAPPSRGEAEALSLGEIEGRIRQLYPNDHPAGPTIGHHLRQAERAGWIERTGGSPKYRLLIRG